MFIITGNTRINVNNIAFYRIQKHHDKIYTEVHYVGLEEYTSFEGDYLLWLDQEIERILNANRVGDTNIKKE